VSSAAKHAVCVTIEQLLKSEQRAAEWIKKMRKIPPSSIENPPNASTA
jgi:hypothetical protein